MSLNDQLQQLYELDSQVRGLRGRLDAATRRRDAQQRKLDQKQQQIAELTEEHKRLQAHAASLEHQSQQIDTKADQLRERMNNATSNKEYSALVVEVNTLKMDKSKLDDQALEQMSQVEQIQGRITELQETSGEQRKLVEGADDEVNQAQHAVGAQLEEARAKREAAAREVPDDVLATFDRLADEYDGEALAEIEEQDRRRMEYACGGCFMKLPMERVNTLMSRPDELTVCPNCRRILCVDQELKSAIVAKDEK